MARLDYFHIEWDENKKIREEFPLYLKKWKRKIQRDTGCNPFHYLNWWSWYKFFYLKDEVVWWLIRNCPIKWLSEKLKQCYYTDYKFPYKVIYSKKNSKTNDEKTNRYFDKYYEYSFSYKEYKKFLKN